MFAAHKSLQLVFQTIHNSPIFARSKRSASMQRIMNFERQTFECFLSIRSNSNNRTNIYGPTSINQIETILYSMVTLDNSHKDHIFQPIHNSRLMPQNRWFHKYPYLIFPLLYSHKDIVI